MVSAEKNAALKTQSIQEKNNNKEKSSSSSRLFFSCCCCCLCVEGGGGREGQLLAESSIQTRRKRVDRKTNETPAQQQKREQKKLVNPVKESIHTHTHTALVCSAASTLWRKKKGLEDGEASLGCRVSFPGTRERGFFFSCACACASQLVRNADEAEKGNPSEERGLSNGNCDRYKREEECKRPRIQ